MRKLRSRKLHKCVIRTKAFRSTRRGQIIHPDVSGKIQVTFLGGSKYYVTSIHEYSMYIPIVPINAKDDVLEVLKKFSPW